MIYLDNAATTFQKPRCVIEAVASAMEHMGNAGRGASDAALDASRTIFNAREALADLFGAEHPSCMVFTANSTESLNIAIKGLFSPGDRVVTTMLEHNSVLRPLYELEERGVELEIVPADERGVLDYAALEAAVTPGTRGVVCTHASNLTGNMVDIARVGKIAHAAGAVFVVDASQTAGAFPIDVQELGVDVLCFTGHKSMLGPQGTGGMYVRSGLEVRPLLSGGSGIDTYNRHHPSQMPTALEAGTLNGHGIAGLAAAVGYLNETGMETIRSRELELMRRFYDGVRAIPSVKVYGDFDAELRAPIVALNIGDYDSSEVSDELNLTYGIVTRPGAHCAPLMHKALGTVSQGAVRFSFSHFNTEEEVDSAVQALAELAKD
ncbi:aminotransferase class V-fold PLP-dependent enzyme [Enorma phocaeensis]|uniref:cysteine desulfurase n=1 Tax=Enorma phocaeensis TaxID=1871019 RepID=A0A921IVH2_9ACTN|nr:aminotransferase class V-fold PLP-dependent enzyme [Enorma phocaeensis]HJG38023.1 aminotransferase class V-fold PLP-dependent enzyme [Enorma phocaeensis]